MSAAFIKAREYIFLHARTLEQSRWKYHFEGGSKEGIIENLKFFQNEDGGFGYGIEPDFFVPNSTPIGTWTACNILDTLELDKNHPMILKVLDYFEHCVFQENGLYYYTIPSVNQYPHAPWWTYTEERKIAGYNPTASIIGFVIKYANQESALYHDFCARLKDAHIYLSTHEVTEKHELRNFLELYHYLEGSAIAKEMYPFLEKYVKKAIDIDIDKWFSTYTTKPLDLILQPTSPGYQYAKDLIQEELRLSLLEQTSDGSWEIPWAWGEDSEEEKISKTHWKGIVTLDVFLKQNKFS